MPLLEDARALLEIDRERVEIAREQRRIAEEQAAILGEAEARALRLAELGDRERPKTLAFLAEAATASQGPARSSGGGGGAAAAGTRSSGAGGGGGGSRGNRVLQAIGGGFLRTEGWIAERCTLVSGGAKIPRPGNPRAEIDGDYVEVDVWDCTAELGEGALYYDPASMAAVQPPLRGSSVSGGQGSSGSGPQRRGGQGILGGTQGVVQANVTSSSSSSSAAPSFTPSTGQAQAPTPGERLIQSELQKGFGSLVRELRSGGDLGLQIRRNGGL